MVSLYTPISYYYVLHKVVCLRQNLHCTQFLGSFTYTGTTRHNIEEGRGRGGSSVGAVVGGTIATLLVVAVIAVLVFAALWWWSKR